MTAETPTKAPRILPSPNAPRAVAKLFLTSQCIQEGALTLRHWRGGWWLWTGTCWRETSRDDILARLYDFTDGASYGNAKGEVLSWLPNKYRISNLMEALKTACLMDDDINPGHWFDGRASGTIVACRNGLLDLTTRELQPHTAQFFNHQALPFDYDADARCLTWDNFIRDLWQDDDEPPMALEEFMGCTVAGKLDLHRILLLVGPPRGGKSLIAKILEALVGPANTSWASLLGLADDKILSSLIGKSLVINGDIRATGRKGPEIAEALLRISGGDNFTIDRKYKDSWTGPLQAQVVQISNEMPTVRDASGALASRYLPLILTESWLGRENRSLEAQLKDELPGILNRALEGLDRVVRNGRFTEPKASQEAADELVDMASPMKRFVDERLDVMPRDGNRDDYTVETSRLLDEYNEWAVPNHEDQIHLAWLGKRLRAVVPHLRRVQPRSDGKRISAYSGVRMRPEEASQQRLARVALAKLHLRTGKAARVIDGGGGDEQA